MLSVSRTQMTLGLVFELMPLLWHDQEMQVNL